MMSVSAINSSPATAPVKQAASANSSFFGEIWDAINPLQHIPIVSSIYRAASDTSISSFANIAGSTLYGGPIGGAIAVAQEGVSALGKAIFGDSKPATVTAQATNIEPAAGALVKPAPTRPQQKLHATTQSWLYQNLNDTTPATSSDSNIKAANSYQKIQSLTTDWLKPVAAKSA